MRASISPIFPATRVRSVRRGGPAPGDAQVLLDLGQGEADRLRLLDGAEEAHRVLVVVPVPARRAGRLGQQSAALVVAQGRGVDASPPRRLSRSHVSTINPDPGAGINQDDPAGFDRSNCLDVSWPGVQDAPPAFLRLAGHPLRWRLLSELARSDRQVRELTGAGGPAAEPGLLPPGPAARRRAGVDAAQLGRRPGHLLQPRSGPLRRAARRGRAALHPGCGSGPAAPAPSGCGPGVLFLCTGNSARSQMAEALLGQLAGGAVEAASAGSHPKPLHPNAVRVMRERGIDISGRRSKHLAEFAGQRFDYVITLCDRVREVCPEFPGASAADPLEHPRPGAARRTPRAAFRRVAAELRTRIGFLLDAALGDVADGAPGPAWAPCCGSGGGSAASGSAGRPRTSRCCASCASSAGGGSTPTSSRTPSRPATCCPGPASTQLAIFCAWRVRGRLGALVGGAAFIVPGLVCILALAALFLAGTPPLWVRGAGAGAGAAVAAVAVHAGWACAGRAGRAAREPRRGALGRVPAGRRGGGRDRRAVAGAGAARLRARRAGVGAARHRAGARRRGAARGFAAGARPAVGAAAGGGGLAALAWVALKVGALSYGGGFVIIPLMQADAVDATTG